MKSHTSYLLLTAALLFCSHGMAQIEDTAVLNTVVVTGEILPTQSSRSVQNVRIITSKMIERQGAVNLKDLLSKELNIRVNNDNILGSSLTLQGISGQNIKILLDGVPLIGRENGNIDLSQINLSNIERVEIIEGPLSVIYGTDALGGVINLISKRITINKPSLLTGHGYYETVGQYNFGVGGIAKLKLNEDTTKSNNIDFAATINRNFFSGYNPVKNSRTMVWKPKEQVFGNFSIFNETGRLRVRFKTDIFNEKIENKGAPVINHLEGYAFDEYYTTNRIITSLHLDYKRNEKTYENLLTSFNFYQRDKTTYLIDLVHPENSTLVPSKEANSSNSFLNFMTRGSYNKQSNPGLNYQYGFDVNINSAFGTRIESDKGRMSDYAVFACAEFKQLKNFNFKPGFRATYNSRYPAPFIPSMQAQYDGVENLIIRYAYGRGFRAPSLKELYLDFVDYNHNIQGNPDLKSEVSNNHNFVLKYKLKVKKKYIFFIESNNYYNHIYNQISLVSVNPNNPEYTYMNIDNFKSTGTNFNVSTQIRKWNVSSGIAYIGIYNNAFNAINEKKYNFSPELRNQVSYSHNHKRDRSKTTFSLFHKYNGARIGYVMDDTRTQVIQTKVQGYTMLDFTMNRPFFNKKLNVTTGCKNIMNVRNITSTGSPGFHTGGSGSMPVSVGRSLFFQLNFIL